MHNAAQPPKHRLNIRACARYRATNNAKHAFTTARAIPVLLYVITFRCFLSHFLLFLFLFGRSCGRQNSSSGSIYRIASPLVARRPTNPFVRSPHTLHRSAMRRHPASTRFTHPVRSPSAKSATAFAAELPFDAPPRLFRLPLFPQAVQGSAFHYVLVSCGTYVLSFAKTSTFIEVFARLCIFIHCVIACFSPIRLLFRSCGPFPVVAPCRTIAPRRRSAAFVSEPRIAARLAVFVGARLHSVFSLPRLPLFDFSISFCLMLHGAPQSFCLFFSAFGFSRFSFDDTLRIFARL